MSDGQKIDKRAKFLGGRCACRGRRCQRRYRSGVSGVFYIAVKVLDRYIVSSWGRASSKLHRKLPEYDF